MEDKLKEILDQAAGCSGTKEEQEKARKLLMSTLAVSLGCCGLPGPGPCPVGSPGPEGPSSGI